MPDGPCWLLLFFPLRLLITCWLILFSSFFPASCDLLLSVSGVSFTNLLFSSPFSSPCNSLETSRVSGAVRSFWGPSVPRGKTQGNPKRPPPLYESPAIATTCACILQGYLILYFCISAPFHCKDRAMPPCIRKSCFQTFYAWSWAAPTVYRVWSLKPYNSSAVSAITGVPSGACIWKNGLCIKHMAATGRAFLYVAFFSKTVSKLLGPMFGYLDEWRRWSKTSPSSLLSLPWFSCVVKIVWCLQLSWSKTIEAAFTLVF